MFGLVTFFLYFCTRIRTAVPWLYRWHLDGARGKSGQHRALHLRNYKLLATVSERQKKITASFREVRVRR